MTGRGGWRWRQASRAACSHTDGCMDVVRMCGCSLHPLAAAGLVRQPGAHFASVQCISQPLNCCQYRSCA